MKWTAPRFVARQTGVGQDGSWLISHNSTKEQMTIGLTHWRLLTRRQSERFTLDENTAIRQFDNMAIRSVSK